MSGLASARAGFAAPITSGGLKESHPHDVTIPEEPVNDALV
jgi:hypothetical protein